MRTAVSSCTWRRSSPAARSVRWHVCARGPAPSSIETLMLPVDYDTVDPNRVVAAEPQAREVWNALRTDRPVPPAAKKSPARGAE